MIFSEFWRSKLDNLSYRKPQIIIRFNLGSFGHISATYHRMRDYLKRHYRYENQEYDIDIYKHGFKKRDETFTKKRTLYSEKNREYGITSCITEKMITDRLPEDYKIITRHIKRSSYFTDTCRIDMMLSDNTIYEMEIMTRKYDLDELAFLVQNLICEIEGSEYLIRRSEYEDVKSYMRGHGIRDYFIIRKGNLYIFKNHKIIKANVNLHFDDLIYEGYYDDSSIFHVIRIIEGRMITYPRLKY